MKLNDFDAEQKAEELLAALGRELGESRASYMEALLDDNQPDPPFFDEIPMEASKTEPEIPVPRKKRHMVRKVVILAAVLILMMGLVVVSSEGVRLKLCSLFFNDAPGSTRILDDTNLVVDVSAVEVGYIPDGFEVVSDEVIGDVDRVVVCSDGKQEILISIAKTELYAANVDNERMDSEKVLINDKQGYLFLTGKKYVIVWQIGDCTFQVTTTMGKDTLVKIAENIFINK